MTFLSPLMLWGLVAASIPVIIHLFSLRHTKEVEFSSLSFIKELKHETIRKLKIRQWLLVLLRMAIIASIVLMISRPVLKGFIPGWIVGEKDARVVVILDNSASMSMNSNGKSLLENGKDQVLDIAEIYDESTEFQFFQTNPLKLVFKGSPGNQSLKREIEGIQLSNDEDHLFLKIDSILTNQDAHEANKECFLISDFSKQIFSDMDGFIPQSKFLTDTSETGWRFYGLQQEELSNNLSLRDVDILSQIRLPNSLLKIETDVMNDGQTDKRNIPIELFLESNRLGQVVASFDFNQKKEFVYQVYPGMSGVINGHLKIPDDNFLLDNQLSFDFSVPEQISCIIISNSTEETFLLETALSAINNQTGFLQIETKINPNDLQLDYTDVLIVYNPGKLEPNIIDEIQLFLQKGGGVIWFAGNRILTQMDKAFETSLKLPKRIGFNTLTGDSYFSVSIAKSDHPVLADMKLRKIETELPQIFQYIQSSPTPESIPILSLNNGDPYLVEIPVLGGTFFYFTSLMDLNWSDFAVKGLAVSLLHRILLYLSTNETETNSILVGETKTLDIPDKYLNSEWTVHSPDSKTVKLIPDYNSKQLKIEDTHELGSYKVMNNQELYISFSTRLSPFEFPSERLKKEEIESLFSHDRFKWVPPQSDLTNHLKHVRHGSSLWRGFLCLAIILFLIETILGTGYSKG